MTVACAVLSASGSATEFESPLRIADITARIMKWLLILVILFGALIPRIRGRSLGTKIKNFSRQRQRRLRRANIGNGRQEIDAHSFANCFTKTEEDLAHSISDAEDQNKTQKTSPTPTPGERRPTETPAATPRIARPRRRKRARPTLPFRRRRSRASTVIPPKVRQLIEPGLS